MQLFQEPWNLKLIEHRIPVRVDVLNQSPFTISAAVQKAGKDVVGVKHFIFLLSLFGLTPNVEAHLSLRRTGLPSSRQLSQGIRPHQRSAESRSVHDHDFTRIQAHPLLATSGDMMAVMLRATCAVILALVGSVVLIAQAPQTRSAATVSITGRVVDQASAPISNVDVSLAVPGSSAPGTTKKTNQSGDFTFSAVSPREYELHFRRPGFRPFTAMVPLSKDLTLPTIVLFQSGIIDATVTAEETAPLVASPITQTLRPQSDQKEPIRTTVCDLMRDPAQFNGKMVRVRATVRIGFEVGGLVDSSCPERLLGGFGDGFPGLGGTGE